MGSDLFLNPPEEILVRPVEKKLKKYVDKSDEDIHRITDVQRIAEIDKFILKHIQTLKGESE